MLELFKSLAISRKCELFDSALYGIVKDSTANEITGLVVAFRVSAADGCNDNFLNKYNLFSDIFHYRPGFYQFNVTLYRATMRIVNVQQPHSGEIELVPF